MQTPVQISFRDMAPSEAIETRVRELAAKLERFASDLVGCRVVIEAPHRHHHKGKLFHVRIDLTLPGHDLVVDREPENHAHEDVYVAIRDAFVAAQRQLQNRVHRRRGDVKAHELPPTGRIARVFPHEGFGFIETADGREIYFHEHAVLNGGFARIEVGDEVRFTEEAGEKGPQATSLHIVARVSARE
jgi:cold shock CspA family protein/ribosome-associated translation inhibitor RaiA